MIQTLTHHGVIFPPEYKPWGLSLNGEKLSSLAEEMLYAYSKKSNNNVVFVENFVLCLQPELTSRQQELNFPIDFVDIITKLSTLTQPKQTLTDKEKEHYKYAKVNGKKEPLGNYLIEPPGIFMGRGDSPLIGLWKYRVKPEDVVINFISDSKPPKPPKGHKWKEIKSDPNVSYIAYYNERIGPNVIKRKEIRFGAASSIISETDQQKFKKGSLLVQNWERMQKWIIDNLNTEYSECALVSWLIQYTSIRIGNKKSKDEENNVVGASTLKCDNIKINGNHLTLEFIGKDSIKFKGIYTVPDYITTAIKKLKQGKHRNDALFTVSSNDVNHFLGMCIEGITAKCFRTAWAEKILLEEIAKTKIVKSWDVNKKVYVIKSMILEVSKKLNHKKTTKKTVDEATAKLKTKIESYESKLKELEKDKTKNKKKIKTIKDKLKLLKQQLTLKTDSHEINLNTALTNYINPIIIFRLCKETGTPLNKIYSATLLKKFEWVKHEI